MLWWKIDVSVVKRRKASNTSEDLSYNFNKFNFWGEVGGEGAVRGGVEKKEEEELKEQIDMKVSTKFQINLSINGWEKYTQSDMGTDHLTDGQTNQQMKSHVEALDLRLKRNQ